MEGYPLSHPLEEVEVEYLQKGVGVHLEVDLQVVEVLSFFPLHGKLIDLAVLLLTDSLLEHCSLAHLQLKLTKSDYSQVLSKQYHKSEKQALLISNASF